jgi:hypothetical protein
MGNLAKNDYIEHWQYGIGKIITISSKSVVVDFVELILQQKSGVEVKPLFYYPTIPVHNMRVPYNHS